MTSSEANPRLDRGEDFVRLFSRHEARMHAYILTMAPNLADAADILQETSSVMWRKFDQFQPGTNFFAWACQIARLEVQSYRKRLRHSAVALSDEFIAAVAAKAEQMNELLESRHAHLLDCMNNLRDSDRDLLQQRYFEGSTIETVASHTRRSVEAAYKALQRIRRQLFECIERASARGGSP
jgi:RNA polymerase sigma-70 factor, ECF subfamily